METFAVGKQTKLANLFCVLEQRKRMQLWVISKGCNMYWVEKGGK